MKATQPNNTNTGTQWHKPNKAWSGKNKLQEYLEPIVDQTRIQV